MAGGKAPKVKRFKPGWLDQTIGGQKASLWLPQSSYTLPDLFRRFSSAPSRGKLIGLDCQKNVGCFEMTFSRIAVV
jgi:hypothetical protein